MTVAAPWASATALLMFGRIYVVTNRINNKQYVGQTITKHSKHGHGHAIKAAYKKYGFKNFDYSVVLEGDYSEKQLNCFEMFWIAVYGTVAPNGYNLEEGGRRGKIVHHSPNKGKTASLETRLKMSIAQKQRSEEIAELNKNRIISDETRLRMSRSKIGRVQSAEEKLKRSEAIKKWHQSRKGIINE